jgi:hypothetical protein
VHVAHDNTTWQQQHPIPSQPVKRVSWFR